MVSIRSNGAQPTGQPVRFYKFVALTILVITIVLLGVVIFMSSKRAEITIITRSEPVDVNTTITIDSTDSNAIVSGFVTSTFVELSQNFSPEGSKTEEGVSEGLVTLYNDTNAAQPLVATTRLLTPDDILFRLKNRVTVPANGSIETEVYADVAGQGGDIGPSKFTIPGLREEKQKVVYAESISSMSGGVRTIGILNQDDVTKAEKILLDALKTKGMELLKELDADSVILSDIVQYTFENDTELGVETDLFTLSGKATVVGVFYNGEELSVYAEDMLGKQVVDNSETLQSVESQPTVVISDYDLEDNTADLVITRTGLVDLDPNSREIQKLMFFGKTEDEVRRYVMSIDHVQGVEMHFRPMWNRSVPHVASHVSITVRQVE